MQRVRKRLAMVKSEHKRAVSPVVGVILMVAIVIILATAIGGFLLAFSDSDESAPTVVVNSDVDPLTGEIRITHAGGDALNGKNTGELLLQGNDETITTTFDADKSIRAGDNLFTDEQLPSGSSISIVWKSPSGDSTSVIETIELSEDITQLATGGDNTPSSNEPFQILVNPQLTSNNKFPLPVDSGEYTVEWENAVGDGVIEDTTGLERLEFEPGTTEAVVSVYSDDHLIIKNHPVVYSNYDALLEVVSWGDIQWGDTSYMFNRAENLVSVPDDESPDLSNVEDMSSMFMEAESFDGNIGFWDTSNVQDMTAVFRGAESFNGNVADWDTSNVEQMGAMFNGAVDFNQDISGWCVPNIASKPGGFDSNAGFEDDDHLQPEWGTCPT